MQLLISDKTFNLQLIEFIFKTLDGHHDKEIYNLNNIKKHTIKIYIYMCMVMTSDEMIAFDICVSTCFNRHGAA